MGYSLEKVKVQSAKFKVQNLRRSKYEELAAWARGSGSGNAGGSRPFGAVQGHSMPHPSGRKRNRCDPPLPILHFAL
jgi:hypothetical protein